MQQQKRWICHDCGREWAYDPSTLTIGHHWDDDLPEKLCPSPDCRSPHIEHVTYTPSTFRGGDYHQIAAAPASIPEPPPVPVPTLEILRINENRTMALAHASPEFDYGTS